MLLGSDASVGGAFGELVGLKRASYSSSNSSKVAINSSLPQDEGWTTYMNNGSASNAYVTTYVICAG